ncbi:NADH-ubiquinone oxidoreductase B18 subunit-domain-containing protein [Jimgerdemannia flammicorona]|uniref:NADH dehydrogenase [ubiquinone] 1 beta subcomplex subunit 7 n=1 Tax=Jimgerdemannia flammicorona TaxID=994334 RepID=A0A433D2M5_9FUNG|nr:NADH-ubiquinone oxidoreductase B18 subunit-domain-containing protein [Jimgerdemannia flammicorona]
MADARIPLEYRDYCAHLLIPLNKCRYQTFYLPWKCENERHSYEKCQYEDTGDREVRSTEEANVWELEGEE